MPEQPFPKARTPVAATPKQCNSSGYAELHCRTNYSFLEGASHPDELVARACELNLTALAITDRHSVAGVVRAHAAAKPANLKLLIGSEIVPVGHSTAVVLATDRAAYGRLCRLLSQAIADRLVACRKKGLFEDYDEFTRRTQFSPAVLALLSDADAFRSLRESRRTAYWKSLPVQEDSELFEIDAPEEKAALPNMTAHQQVVADYRTTGMSLRQHPIAFIRGELSKRLVIQTKQLLTAEPDRRYKVAGLVLLRQRPSTAKGITFMTLEDESGTANLIVRVDVWERFHVVARQAVAMIVQGILQRKDGIAHVLVDRIEDLTQALSNVGNQSRDFR